MTRLLPVLTLAAAGLLLALPARAQPTPTVWFDEGDGAPTYHAASEGRTTSAATLALGGPTSDKLPLTTAQARSGQRSGVLTYGHAEGGSWQMDVGRAAFQAFDATATDSLVLYLNAPAPIPGTDLPRIGLVDMAGRSTTLLPLDAGGRIGFATARSGFLSGSTTDAVLSVRYLDVLPPDQVRPGYPEDLLLTFADEPVDTSVAGIGVPTVPARFTVATAGGLPLDVRFRDTDGDGTLSAVDEYIEVLTPEAAGSTRWRPTWRIEVAEAPQTPPGAGDTYLLAVDNAGLDGDPTTWHRISLALIDFGPLGPFDRTQIRAVRFANGPIPTTTRTLWFDEILLIDDDPASTPPEPPTGLHAETGDASVVLRWSRVDGAIGYEVFRQDTPESPFTRLTDPLTGRTHFADLGVANGASYTYIVRSAGLGSTRSADSDAVDATPQADRPDAYLELLARLTFDFFWYEANPVNGLVRDRSTNPSLCSIAAVGFGLSAITVGIDRGWISRTQGVERILNTLRFFWNSPQGTQPDATGYRGFYYHFLNMDTGRRSGTTELSTIDTALLLAGVLHVGMYFDGGDPDEAEIRDLADRIYERVEWDWAVVRPPLVSHGWRPESGFIDFDWRGYNEAMLLYLLALGSPTHPIAPEAWDAWTSTYRWETYYGYSFVRFPPLFGHQYSHVWFDFRGIQDAYMREKGIDYFENSRRATLANRAYAIENPRRYPNYGPTEWGLTASDVPDGYRARGAPPPQNDDGTIAPTAAGGSIAFTPDESRAALRQFYAAHHERLWGPYGLRDAYNIAVNWFAPAYLGIDQGPILLMYENHRTGAIWDVFMQHPAVQRGLDRAGFTQTSTDIAQPPDQPAALSVSLSPHPIRIRADLRYTLPEPGRATLTVYDVLGREVAVLVDAWQPAGSYAVSVPGHALAAGVYVYVLRHGGAVRTGTMVRVR